MVCLHHRQRLSYNSIHFKYPGIWLYLWPLEMQRCGNRRQPRRYVR
jgi:hypothetical protein